MAKRRCRKERGIAGATLFDISFSFHSPFVFLSFSPHFPFIFLSFSCHSPFPTIEDLEYGAERWRGEGQRGGPRQLAAEQTILSIEPRSSLARRTRGRA